jgi:hypothetical protein
MRCSTRILASCSPKIIMVICHWGHLSSVSLDILFCNLVSTSVIFFQLPNRHFWCHAACSLHHHMPSMSSPNPPFHVDPRTSEFIKTMKSAATPPPRRSTRNANAKAPYSPDLGKAPPPSSRATRADKKRQTMETAPSTPIAPSPSGKLAASLSPPLFFHSRSYCQ